MSSPTPLGIRLSRGSPMPGHVTSPPFCATPTKTTMATAIRWRETFRRSMRSASRSLLATSGKTDGRRRRCLVSHTCPRIFEVNSANEYWVKAASLLHTDTLGNDLPDPANVRFYLLSSLAHNASTGPGICQQPGNPLIPNAGLRALLVALDEWVTRDRTPPANRVPRRANGTLVSSMPQDAVGFPSIPAVTYNGLMTTGDLLDFGPLFNDGMLTTLPPLFLGSPYPAFVPRTDTDGNDVAGMRLPQVAVPLATYTGWSLRALALLQPDTGKLTALTDDPADEGEARWSHDARWQETASGQVRSTARLPLRRHA